MDLSQLRYFFHVATRGGLAPAATALGVSLPAVSKAIARLEEDLATPLFDRKGRALALTDEGRHLLRRAEEILALVGRTREELRGEAEVPELVIAGREIFLERFGLPLVDLFRRRHPQAVVRLKSCSGDDALRAVDVGEAHLALSVQKPEPGWQSLVLADLRFVTAVARSHPLHALQSRAGRVHVKELRQHAFVSPNSPVFGRVGGSRSIDGWRDDVHPRRIAYVVESLLLYARLLRQGTGVGYMPDFYAEELGLTPLTIEGCSFQIRQKLRLSAKRADDHGWLGRLVDDARTLGV